MRLILIILFPFLAQAQKMPTTGEVLADSNFICTDPYGIDPSVYGLNDICSSENFIEIRLIESVMATTRITVLSWKNNKWMAEKYYPEYVTKRKKVIATIPRKIILTDSAGTFSTLFDSLRSHQLFLIPDFRNLVIRARKEGAGFSVISDGILYIISFKVGLSFRRYGYGNPDNHLKDHPTYTELKDVIRIIELLDSLFYKYAD